MTANIDNIRGLPDWVPETVRLYLSHTEAGHSLRALARRQGCHPSTVMRQVRRFENRRDDPLVDEALALLGQVQPAGIPDPESEDDQHMTAPFRSDQLVTDEATIQREARRILRRLGEAGAVLAIAPDMEKAVVLKENADGQAIRTAVVARGVARAFALKEWIACRRSGRVTTYAITSTGRAALKRLLGAENGKQRDGFAEQHRAWGHREVPDEDGATRRLRANMAESPVTMLARRKDKDGNPFLSPELVAAAERLREDFELAQMGPRVAQNWDRFLTGGARGSYGDNAPGSGPADARARVEAALADLGPGLGDMALRCCCYLEGLEAAERRMGWSARSGKIVLRIALMRLKRHYDETGGPRAQLIG
ncbi:helix-turn-helix domain containing protein [Rhodobacteraceae bacterium WD3A24]|nr:helix-turn-helix domain containing protein [Rhodobacteraceae bacterium WD3A24]